MKILHLISSPRKTASLSIKLGNAVVDKLRSENSDSTLNVHNIAETPLPHLEESHLNSFFTSEDERTPEMHDAIRHSDAAIAELMDADKIVLGVPMYNFGIHSALKSWIDHICRAGKTFRYTEAGFEGLVKNKKLYLAISSGGVYTKEEFWKAFDFTESYLRVIFGFIGITDISVFRIEGTDVPEIKELAWEKALNSIVL